MGKPTDKEVREEVQEYQKEKGDTPDSRDDFSQAGHDARNDAVDTDYEVRPTKE